MNYITGGINKPSLSYKSITDDGLILFLKFELSWILWTGALLTYYLFCLWGATGGLFWLGFSWEFLFLLFP